MTLKKRATSPFKLTRTLRSSELVEIRRTERLTLKLDARGTYALVEYLDISGTRLGSTLWDLRSDQIVSGDYADLHPDGLRALRREGRKVAVVELATNASVTLRGDIAGVLLCPDTPLAVDRPRRDTEPRAKARAVSCVYDLATGRLVHEVATSSVLEAFLANGRLASIGSRGSLTIWDLKTGKATGKIAGPGKPASIRVDPSGSRIAVSASDGAYAVFDADTCALLHKGRSKIIFNRDAAFDGRHYVGTSTLLDTSNGKAKSHERGWLMGDRHSSLARERTLPVTFPRALVLTTRELIGDPVVELWDVDRGAELGSLALKSHAAALAVAKDQLVVAHLPTRLDADDDPADYPALTVLAFSPK